MSNNEGGYRVGTVAHITAGRGVGRSMMAAALLAQALKPKTYVLSRNDMNDLYRRHMGAHEVEPAVCDAAFDMARDAERRGFQAGLAAAADYLRGTASDYQQGVDRDQNSGRKLTENERRGIRLNQEKIALLKGQAGHVLDLPFK